MEAPLSNEGMRYNPLKGGYRVLIPSFPTKAVQTVVRSAKARKALGAKLEDLKGLGFGIEAVCHTS